MPLPIDLIPTDTEALLALSPEELGLRMLPRLFLIARGHPGHIDLDSFKTIVTGVSQFGTNAHAVYPRQHYLAISIAIEEAWWWLEGQALLVPNLNGSNRWPHEYRRLSRRAQTLAQASDPERRFTNRVLPRASLHPAIRDDISALFDRGKFESAVFQAMKAVEVAVRAAAGYSDAEYGAPMIAKAFNSESGPLRDPAQNVAERGSLRELMTGAFGLYKNPHSHRNEVLTDPDEAAEVILLANLLLRIIDGRRSSHPCNAPTSTSP